MNLWDSYSGVLLGSSATRLLRHTPSPDNLNHGRTAGGLAKCKGDLCFCESFLHRRLILLIGRTNLPETLTSEMDQELGRNTVIALHNENVAIHKTNKTTGNNMKNATTTIVLLVLLFPIVSFCQSSEAKASKRIINTENAPPVIGPFSQGAVAGKLLFTSGQLPINPKTGVVPETIEEQTILVLENIKAIVTAAGSSLDNVVKCTVYLQHFSDFAAMNKIYSKYFPSNPPARATVEVSKMAKNALIEIDAIAIVE